MSEFAGAYLGVTLFLIVLAIVWILLPFAIFGTKPKLDVLIEEVRNTNAHLVMITSLLRVRNTPPDEGGFSPGDREPAVVAKPAPLKPSPGAYSAGRAFGGLFRRDRG